MVKNCLRKHFNDGVGNTSLRLELGLCELSQLS